MSTLEIPLFPLHTVLFPGGVLPLRIFEPRYVAMVGECMRNGNGFGVVLIREGREAGAPAIFHEIGTLARIADFDRLADGMLGITCQGGQKLRASAHRVQPDQLIVAEVEWLAPEPPLPLAQRYVPLAELLRDLLEREELQSYRRWLAEDWVNTGWIGCRLAELLPLPLDVKQTLLEMDGGAERLQALTAILQDWIARK
ncbi:MAG: LON peptidase substrate-binding domain-containing protein [Gammaproteobacteria bacterium]